MTLTLSGVSTSSWEGTEIILPRLMGISCLMLLSSLSCEFVIVSFVYCVVEVSSFLFRAGQPLLCAGCF